MQQPVREKEAIQNCPVFIASQILGKKWAIILLQTLLTPEAEDGLRFSEIQRELSWVSPKVLTQRLRDLEEFEVLDRRVDASMIPPHVSYELTTKGEGLRKVLESMQEWGRRFGGERTALCFGGGFDCCSHCPQSETD